MTLDEARVMRELQTGDPLSTDELTGRTRMDWHRTQTALNALAFRGLLVRGEASRPPSWHVSDRGRSLLGSSRGRALVDVPQAVTA